MDRKEGLGPSTGVKHTTPLADYPGDTFRNMDFFLSSSRSTLRRGVRPFLTKYLPDPTLGGWGLTEKVEGVGVASGYWTSTLENNKKKMC